MVLFQAGEVIDFGVACRGDEFLGCGAGLDEGGDGIGGAAGGPAGVDAGFHGQEEWGAGFAVQVVDGGAAGDQETDGFVPATPGGDMKGRTFFCDVEVRVGLVADGGHGIAEVEEMADAVGIGVTRKTGEHVFAFVSSRRFARGRRRRR